MDMDVSIGITDDNKLFVKSLASLIDTEFEGFQTVAQAFSGEELLKKLETIEVCPEIILLDVNMPNGMGGIKTAEAVTAKYPLIKLVALSQEDNDIIVINMLKAGCCAYLLKDINPEELKRALKEVNIAGYYNGDADNIRFRRMLRNEQNNIQNQLTAKELDFLKLACTDFTYKQIAEKMDKSERTIDGYRESLFEKLNVQSRVGMAMEAIRRKLVSL
jgi:DNA-binding NarL/FixJ family response regulator